MILTTTKQFFFLNRELAVTIATTGLLTNQNGESNSIVIDEYEREITRLGLTSVPLFSFPWLQDDNDADDGDDDDNDDDDDVVDDDEDDNDISWADAMPFPEHV